MDAPGLLTSFWSALWPPRCPLCAEPIDDPDGFCDACAASITPVAEAACLVCGMELDPAVAPTDGVCGRCKYETPSFAAARAFGRYNGALAEAVRGLKFNAHRHLLPALRGLIVAADERHFAGRHFDVIVPVPLHRARVAERGFNQATDLARALARRRSVPLLPSALVRRKDTKPQYGLNLKERRINVEGAFKVMKPEKVRDRRVLIVDDVMTTGATVNECARVLVLAKATEVCVLTVARAV